jgi:hypothetical protein
MIYMVQFHQNLKKPIYYRYYFKNEVIFYHFLFFLFWLCPIALNYLFELFEEHQLFDSILMKIKILRLSYIFSKSEA